MNLVRRSVAFPEDIYESLRLEAFSRRISVNQLMVERLRPKEREKAGSRKGLERQIKQDLIYFRNVGDRVRKKLGNIDVRLIVRDERSRGDE